jgi:prevent-host-death family protein
MIRHVSAREARSQFAELTDRVRYTGEPVIVEKNGKPYVAVVSIQDLENLEDLRRRQNARDEFTRLAKKAALEATDPEPTEEDIVEAVKRTREEMYRERYGPNAGPDPDSLVPGV